MSRTAFPCRSAHAEPDWLERFAAFRIACHETNPARRVHDGRRPPRRRARHRGLRRTMHVESLGRKHRWIKPLCRRIFHRFEVIARASRPRQADPLHPRRRGLSKGVVRDASSQDCALRPRSTAHGGSQGRARRLRPRSRPRRTSRAGSASRPQSSTGSPTCGASIPPRERSRTIAMPGSRSASGCASWRPRSRSFARFIEEFSGKFSIQFPCMARPTDSGAAGHAARSPSRMSEATSCSVSTCATSSRRSPRRVSMRSSPRWAIPIASRACWQDSAHAGASRVARRGGLAWEESKRLGVPHLPQGAPTSPSLANLCTCTSTSASNFGPQLRAEYTRYADDLAFSGGEPLRRRVEAITSLVAAIALEEGFSSTIARPAPCIAATGKSLPASS